MHHPKPNKTGSLALRITHVYSIFAAYSEGSSKARAIECVCVCASIHICMFAVGSAEYGEPLQKLHRNFIHTLWKCGVSSGEILSLYKEITLKKLQFFLFGIATDVKMFPC